MEKILKNIGSYQVIAEIGRGNDGVVYKATKNNKIFAIKVPHPESLSDPSAADRFRRQACTMARLNHPGLVGVVEIGDDNGLLFLVMEYLDGKTLQQAISEQGAFSSDAIVKIAIEVGGALAEIHRFYYIHRDVKPDNIILCADGRIKLIDLGMIGDHETIPKDLNDNTILGTIQYMSPEQGGLIKSEVDERSDLYSFGVTLYQALTARLPFEAKNYSELLQAHASITPAAPLEIDSRIDPLISEIIVKMIKKDPDDRYQLARGMIYDFENLSKIKQEKSENGKYLLGQKDFHSVSIVSEIFGRDQEINITKEILSSAEKKNSGSVLIIEAESGMGKSRLANQLVEQALGQEFVLFQAKCSDKAGSSPLMVLQDAFDRAAKLIENHADKISLNQKNIFLSAASGLESVLFKISPNLCKSIGLAFSDKNQILNLGQDQIINQVNEFFVRLGNLSKGVLVYIDDLQWVDEVTLSVLEKSIAQIGVTKLHILLTIRSENVDQLLKQRHAALKIHSSKNANVIKLGKLSEQAILQQVESLLGNKKIAIEAVGVIAKAAGGNPFLVQEVTFGLMGSGALQFVDEVWVLDRKLSGNLNFSMDAFRLILSRSSQLTSEQLDILKLCSLLGTTVTPDLVGVISHRPLDFIEESLKAALKINFMEIDFISGNYRFFHDKIREALLSQFSPTEIKDKYDVIADNFYNQKGKDYFSEYDLARYYRLSNWNANPIKAYQSNSLAGFKMLSNFAYHDSIEILEFANGLSDKISVSKNEKYELRRNLALACMNIGDYTKAMEYIDLAKASTDTDLDIAELLFIESRIETGRGNNTTAQEKLVLTMRSLGLYIPNSKAKAIFQMLWMIFVYIFRCTFSVGYGRLSTQQNSLPYKQKKMLSEILEAASYLSYLSGNQVEMSAHTLRSFLNSYALGDGFEMAVSECFAGLFWSALKLNSIVNWHFDRARSIADRINDDRTRSYVSCIRSWSMEMCGATIDSEKEALDSVPGVKRYLGSFVTSMALANICSQYLQKGKAKDSLEWMSGQLEDIDKTNNNTIMANARGMIYSQANVLGRFSNLSQLHEEWVTLAAKVPTSRYAQALLALNNLIVLWDKEDFGPTFEKYWQDLLRIGIFELVTNFSFVCMMHGRFSQFEKASPENRKVALSKLKKVMWSCILLANNPIHRCHRHVVEAGLLRIAGKYDAASKLLDKAESVALAAGSIYGKFFAARERARLARDSGNIEKMKFEAEWSRKIAKDHGYFNRLQKIAEEFSLKTEEPLAYVSSTISSKRGITLSEKRILDSLLSVSRASVTSVQPVEQIRAILDEILKVFGAERSFVFSVDEKSKKLNFNWGRDAQKIDLIEPIGYSSTVVKKVFADEKPLIITGSEEMGEIGSKSAILHDLRCILATPLVFNEKVIGVIYLDSRLTKGLFSESDLEVFNAISSHVAIALEASRQAVLEAERREMAKDLEMSAMVQRMLLPKVPGVVKKSYEIVSLYLPATKCGGDWWWQFEVGHHVVLFVGDVTGHGAGAAMITSAIATNYRIHARNFNEESFDDLLTKVNRDFIAVAEGEYMMTGMACILNTESKILRWFSFGGPQLMLSRSDKGIEFIGEPGTPLGVETFRAPSGEIVLSSKDRIYIFTDGILEMEKKSKGPIRKKEIIQFLGMQKDRRIADLPNAMADQVSNWRQDLIQMDDYTFVGIEIK